MRWPFRHRRRAAAAAPRPRTAGSWRALPPIRTTIRRTIGATDRTTFLDPIARRQVGVLADRVGHATAADGPVGVAWLAGARPGASGPPTDREGYAAGVARFVGRLRGRAERRPDPSPDGGIAAPAPSAPRPAVPRPAEREPLRTDDRPPGGDRSAIAPDPSPRGEPRAREPSESWAEWGSPTLAAPRPAGSVPDRLGPLRGETASPFRTDVVVPRADPVRSIVGRRMPVVTGRRGPDRLAPPDDVRYAVERRYGVSLDRVAIARDPGSAARAREHRARAFAEEHVIRLPRDAGAVEATATKALLAHELTHVAQRRRERHVDEGSEQGRRLEAEAHRAEERWVRGEDSLPQPPPAPMPPTVRPSIEATGILERSPWPRAQAAPEPSAAPEQGTRPVAGIQRAPEPAPSASGTAPPDRDAIGQLYEQVVARLRAELLVDRERAGLLADPR